jgi:predicted transposase YbfD/YdcC
MIAGGFMTVVSRWLHDRCKFEGIQTMGAIATKSETRYYISSRTLTAAELLDITRQEWAVESMHWQLDVIFGEDITTIHDANTQIVLNILRIAQSCTKHDKNLPRQTRAETKHG